MGPAGSANINGAENYLVKFTGATTGGNSQVFDDGTSVGIGTDTPTAKLSVNGDANNSTGSWSVFSDARIKTVNAEFTDGLSVIERLRPVLFTYTEKAPFKADGEQIGVIAQELEKVAPYMVSQQENGAFKDLREVNNQAYVFLLINAVKEQQALINAQQEKIQSLEAAGAAMRSDLSEQNELIQANMKIMLELKAAVEAQTQR